MAKVVILCGGYGTRLREETEYKPKPMVTIGHNPILWHIMMLYSYYKLYDFVLCLGYKGEIIKEYFYNFDILNSDFSINMGTKTKKIFSKETEEANWTVTLADTGLNSMTGSRIKQIEKHIQEDYFLTTYGDAVSDINIDKLIEFHKKSGKIATLTGVRPTSKYGVIVAEDDSVIKFNEKPLLKDYVNGGFFVFEKEIFNYLNKKEDCTLEIEVLEKLANQNQLAIYRHDGFWQCMETYRDYESLNSMFNSQKNYWMIWETQNKNIHYSKIQQRF